MDKTFRNAVELAHLLDTHPDTVYTGGIESDSLLMNFSKQDSEYQREKELIEESIYGLQSQLKMSKRSNIGDKYSEDRWLNNEIEDMLDEIERSLEADQDYLGPGDVMMERLY